MESRETHQVVIQAISDYPEGYCPARSQPHQSKIGPEQNMNTVQLIPIIPRSGIYLSGHGHGDDRRFARLFKGTWLTLPLAARRKMLRHWRHDERRGIGGFWGTPTTSPTIELLSGWFPTESALWEAMDGLPEAEQPLAQTFGGGHTLRFWSRALDPMPDDLVRRLVAHELAHVHQFACGRSGADCEAFAEQLASCWGYPGGPIREWAAGRRRKKPCCLRGSRAIVN
jgi:hypothetical protein